MLLSGLSRLAKTFGSDRAGNIALIFALAFPGLVMMVVAGVELQALASDKARMQTVADAAALNAATQMRFAANEQLLTRTESFALSELSDLKATPDQPDVRFTFDGNTPTGVRVSLTARRLSFFGNLVPPGGFVTTVESTAEQLGSVPLCVLAAAVNGSDVLNLPQGSIIARSCLVHSNRDIALGNGSLLDAAAVQASGAIKGGTPANAESDMAIVTDPLTAMFNGTGPGACEFKNPVKTDKATVTVSVQPGVHCRHFDIENGTLQFLPGVHHLFSGQLQLKKDAKIVGDDVTLVIWRQLDVKFDDGKVALLDLTGSRGGTGEAGRWAGFALAVDPQRTGNLTLDFNEIRKLEGVVYAPSIRLIIPGGINSSEVTPWTVIVAKELRVEGGRTLQINADYSASNVPVPNGVGNKATDGAPVRLIR